MALSEQRIDEMDISAFLNEYVYQDQQADGWEGKTINEIIKTNPKLRNNEVIKNALEKNPEWGSIELVNQSSNQVVKIEVDGKTIEQKIPMEKLIACTFEDPKTGNLYVVYRGTGDGKWVDNGEALAIPSSEMQDYAKAYFDTIAQNSKYGFNDGNGKVIVTGHSKGGNSAQFVTLSSEYGYLIDNCYSLDGQGFSHSAIEKFIEQYGEDYYNAQREKMYSICGHNDYVHDLGVTVIPEDNTYILNSTTGEDFAAWHENAGLFNDETGRINFSRDENGNVISVEQGPMGKLAKELSERMMLLNDEDLEDCAISIMTILEFAIDYKEETGQNLMYGTGKRKYASPEEWAGFFAVGVPIIIDLLINSENAHAVIKDMLTDIIVKTVENGEIGKIIGAVIILPFVAAVAAVVLKEIAKLSIAIEIIETIIFTIKDFSEEVYKKLIEIRNAFIAWVEGFKKWFNENLNYGYRYASANPDIIVDTGKLENYAERIKNINRRLSNVDRRMDNLYRHVRSFEDLVFLASRLLSIMRIDIMTSYSLRLKRCENYLRETSTNFKNAERNILSKK